MNLSIKSDGTPSVSLPVSKDVPSWLLKCLVVVSIAASVSTSVRPWVPDESISGLFRTSAAKCATEPAISTSKDSESSSLPDPFPSPRRGKIQC